MALRKRSTFRKRAILERKAQCRLENIIHSVEQNTEWKKVTHDAAEPQEFSPEIFNAAQARDNSLAESYDLGVDRRATKPIREITIDRNDIIMALADEAGLTENKKDMEGASARVTALKTLAEIYRLLPTTGEESSEFDGWTTDELKDYATTGHRRKHFHLLNK